MSHSTTCLLCLCLPFVAIRAWALGFCTAFSYFFTGLDIALAEALVHPTPWAFAPITSFLAMPISQPAVILAMLAHWANYLFPWASLVHLLYSYPLLCLWVCWLSFLPCWPIGFITSFLGLPQPIYFSFTSFYAYGPVSCYSCHLDLLGLLPLSIFFPFHLSLLLGFFCHWIICQKWASTKCREIQISFCVFDILSFMIY